MKTQSTVRRIRPKFIFNSVVFGTISTSHMVCQGSDHIKQTTSPYILPISANSTAASSKVCTKHILHLLRGIVRINCLSSFCAAFFSDPLSTSMNPSKRRMSKNRSWCTNRCTRSGRNAKEAIAIVTEYQHVKSFKG